MIHGERKQKVNFSLFNGKKGKVALDEFKSKQFELRKQISELETIYNDLTKQIESLNNNRPEFKLIDGETYTFKDYQNYLVLDKECSIKIDKLYNIRHDITMKLFDLKIELVD